MSKISGAEWVSIYERAEWLEDRTKAVEVMGDTLRFICTFETDFDAPMGRYDTLYDGEIQKQKSTFVQGDVSIIIEFRGKVTEIRFRRLERLNLDKDYKKIYTQGRFGYGVYLSEAAFKFDGIPDEDLTFIKLILL